MDALAQCAVVCDFDALEAPGRLGDWRGDLLVVSQSAVVLEVGRGLHCAGLGAVGGADEGDGGCVEPD